MKWMKNAWKRESSLNIWKNSSVKTEKTMTRRKKIRTDKKKKRYVPEIRHVPSLVKREFWEIRSSGHSLHCSTKATEESAGNCCFHHIRRKNGRSRFRRRYSAAEESRWWSIRSYRCCWRESYIRNCIHYHIRSLLLLNHSYLWPPIFIYTSYYDWLLDNVSYFSKKFFEYFFYLIIILKKSMDY